MSLRVVARLLERPISTVSNAVQALGLKPSRVGKTYCVSWQELEQIELYLSSKGKRRG